MNEELKTLINKDYKKITLNTHPFIAAFLTKVSIRANQVVYGAQKMGDNTTKRCLHVSRISLC